VIYDGSGSFPQTPTFFTGSETSAATFAWHITYEVALNWSDKAALRIDRDTHALTTPNQSGIQDQGGTSAKAAPTRTTTTSWSATGPNCSGAGKLTPNGVSSINPNTDAVVYMGRSGGSLQVAPDAVGEAGLGSNQGPEPWLARLMSGSSDCAKVGLGGFDFWNDWIFMVAANTPANYDAAVNGLFGNPIAVSMPFVEFRKGRPVRLSVISPGPLPSACLACGTTFSWRGKLTIQRIPIPKALLPLG